MRAECRENAEFRQHGEMSKGTKSTIGHKNISGFEAGMGRPQADISWVRSGAATTSRSSPVAASNSARILATGKPHPAA